MGFARLKRKAGTFKRFPTNGLNIAVQLSPFLDLWTWLENLLLGLFQVEESIWYKVMSR